MLHRPDPRDRTTWQGLLQPFADPSPAATPPIHPFGPDDPAVAAWTWCLNEGPAEAFASLPGRRAADDDEQGTNASGKPRSLLASRDDLAIEVWTECELAVLHAGFRRLVELEPDPDPDPDPATVPPVTIGAARLARDLADAVAWHLEHTQPDNATTHPWGLHAILELGRPTGEAIDHAGSMLHAMQAAAVMTPDGRPDPISRWIVADLVRTFEHLAARSGTGEIGLDPDRLAAGAIEPHR